MAASRNVGSITGCEEWIAVDEWKKISAESRLFFLYSSELLWLRGVSADLCQSQYGTEHADRPIGAWQGNNVGFDALCLTIGEV